MSKPKEENPLAAVEALAKELGEKMVEAFKVALAKQAMALRADAGKRLVRRGSIEVWEDPAQGFVATYQPEDHAAIVNGKPIPKRPKFLSGNGVTPYMAWDDLGDLVQKEKAFG